MGPRACAPVRHDGVLLGFLWVIPGDRPLDDREQAATVDAAATVGALLRRRQGAAAAERRETERLVAGVLDPDDPAAREAAAEALRARRGWDRGARIAVAVAAVPPGGPDDPADVGARAERRWHAGELAWRAAGERVVALAPTTDAGALARALQRAGARHAGAASATGLGAAHTARAAAEDALLVCAALPSRGPAAADAELGAWPAAARLWDAAGRPAQPALLAPLRDHRDAAELVAALEAVLERAGDVAGAARALHVHRATLYRRLARAEGLLGIDLRRGDDVLRAHLAVRAWRLAQGLRGGTAPAPEAPPPPRTASTNP
nr:helix-turn-helix domain-containing protein [Patulibacter sp. SYSU D01012]